jgi:hypothetical protein
VELSVEVYGVAATATFLILDGTGVAVLGRKTATSMGVLRIGPPSEVGCAAVQVETPGTQDAFELLKSDNGHGDTGVPGHLRLSRILLDNAQAFQGIGCVRNFTADIHLSEDSRPVCHPPSRVPIHLAKAVDKELQLLEQAGVIEPVSGPAPWVARMVVVPKAQPGQVRITQDLRDVNKFVIRERHQIPTFEEVTGDMAGAKLFSELDVAKAFYQIPVAESARQLLTFSTPRGLRRLTRLCMGLSTAQEILQSVMSGVLAGLAKVKWMHDDIVVYGNDLAEHKANLTACLQRLREHGITLNPAKCKLARRSITFMGMQLSEQGIKPTEDKLEAVRTFKPPENASQVRSFLGLVGYLSIFTPQLADTAAPLRRLTRKGATWQWSAEEQKAFEDLKAQICSAKALSFFDQRRDTELIVDAGPMGLGAILAQRHSDGTSRPVAYASRA